MLNSCLELVISIICAITVAGIIVPLHLLFAPLARTQEPREEQKADGR
nr:hypothetical protein [Nostoc sp. DedQUE07]